MRTQLTAPLVAKAQEELNKRLVADLKKQQLNPAAIQKLKNLLAGKKKTKESESEAEHQKLAMDPDEQPKATRSKTTEDKPVQQALVTIRKASFSFRDVLDKDKELMGNPASRGKK